jgi:hypothetical protein
MDVTYFENPDDLERFVRKIVEPVNVVLDIGPGIYPINHFVPNLHILVEPYEEYVEILKERMGAGWGHLILKGLALDVLKLLPDNSVDSVFLIDVIEHLEKNEGKVLLKEVDRVARKQIVIFTPLGFMPQHIELDKRDRWGLHGGDFQEHKSGWLPNEFSPEWEIYVCEEYHSLDDDGNSLEQSFGAFYAIKNVVKVEIENSKNVINNFFRPTAQELAHKALLQELEATRNSLQMLLSEKLELINSKSWKITSPLRKVSYLLGLNSEITNKIKAYFRRQVT